MRYSSSKIYSLVLHADAEEDLDLIFEEDEQAASDIAVFLEEIDGNQDSLDRLTQRKYVCYDDPQFDIDEWQETRKTQFNLWRLRLLYLEGASKYRIIYAFHTIEFRYYVLAILHRDFNYDLNDPRITQIFETYDALNIPRH